MYCDRLPERLIRAFPKSVTFSQGRTGETNRFSSTTLASEAFVEFVSMHREGDKDGSAWSPFHFKHDTRRSENCIGADVLALDIDDGTAEPEIVRALRENMRAAVVVSSHSHFVAQTEFRTYEYDDWRKAHEHAADEDFMRTRDKGYRENVWRGSRILRGDDSKPVVKEERGKDGTVRKITVVHGPCPKFRIIAPLAEAFRVTDYANAAQAADAWRRKCLALAEELGVKTDPKALLLTQLFFDPRHPVGAVPVSRFVGGWPFGASTALTISNQAKTNRREKEAERSADFKPLRTGTRGKLFKDNFDVLRAAVMAIPHDERINMNTWVAIIGAIYDETDGSAAGCELAHEWSATWTKGYDRDETENVWRRAARRHGSNTARATGATIRLRAMNDGWVPPVGWTWQDGWSREIHMTNEQNQAELIERLNNEFAVIKNRGRVRILCEADDANGLSTFDLLPERDFLLLTKNRGVIATQGPGGKSRFVDGSVYWLKSPQRREFRGLVFHPGEELRPERGSNGPPAFFNLWRGWGVQPCRRGSCDLLKKHLQENVCRGDSNLYQWLVDWMAHLFQRPREKPGVAVVMRGKKGVGKSIVGKTLGALVGPHHYFVASQQEQLVGKFNAQLAASLLIQAEEAFFSHDPKAWGALKDLITRETRTVEPKGVDAFLVNAYDRLVITSNEDAVIPAEAGERRYAVFDVADAHARDTAFFAALEDELKANGNSGYGRLIWEFMQRDLGEFDCRKAPETAALAEQKLHNLKPVARWMLARLQDGWFWKVKDNEEARFDFDQSDEHPVVEAATNKTVGKETVRENYLQYSRDMRDRYPLDERELGKWLVDNVGFRPAQRRLKVERFTGTARRRKGDREHCYRIPLLDDARERFIQSFELPLAMFSELEGELD